MEHLEQVNCEICGSDEYTVIYEGKHENLSEEELVQKYRSSGDEVLMGQVVRCNGCRLIYVSPRLKSNLLLKSYSEGVDEKFVSQTRAREKTFGKSLTFVERYTETGKILDIGTANGSFLKVAKDRGWEVNGCEPNKWLCEWGKKHYDIRIDEGDLLQQKYEENSFDCVTLWDVLEHTPNPKEVLMEANRLLKQYGILVVNYPDIRSLISDIMRSKWVFLLSVHLFYFDKYTIDHLLDDCGFTIIRTKPHFQTLELGYLVFRMRKYNETLYKIGNFVCKTLRINGWQIPYWLGQTLVIAGKR